MDVHHPGNLGDVAEGLRGELGRSAQIGRSAGNDIGAIDVLKKTKKDFNIHLLCCFPNNRGKQENLCDQWSILPSTPWSVAPVAWSVPSTPWTVEWDRGWRTLRRGCWTLDYADFYKEMMQKVAKTAQKVKEKKGPSLAHHAVG